MSISTLVLGSVNVDLVIHGPRLPGPGETVLGGEFLQASGGKGANQAVAAARAAAGTVAFVGGVGDDPFGTQSREGLTREGLELSGLITFPQTSTGIALILVDAAGQNLISVASGANARLSPDHVDALPDELFAGAKVFLTSLEIPLPTVRRGLERAREQGLITILNPAPADRGILEGNLLSLVDILTPNETELCQLTEETWGSEAEGAPTGAKSTADDPSRWRAAAVKSGLSIGDCHVGTGWMPGRGGSGIAPVGPGGPGRGCHGGGGCIQRRPGGGVGGRAAADRGGAVRHGHGGTQRDPGGCPAIAAPPQGN